MPTEHTLALDREGYLTQLICEFAGLLQGILDDEEIRVFFSVVGQTIGRRIDEHYRRVLGCDRLDLERLLIVVEDLTRRIGDPLLLAEQDERRLVYRKLACPFDDHPYGRRALCTIASNVVASIVAENLGYAKVCLESASSDDGSASRVLLYLDPDDDRVLACAGQAYER